MALDEFKLPEDRLATTDKSGARVFLYTADYRGWWKNFKSKLHSFLILLFLVLPWIKINGHQAVLFDIPHRRFSIFGLTFWSHDVPMVVFVFGAAALALGLVTSIWGRIWCGHACPQTVFIDSVFRRIDRWVEGRSRIRRLRDEGPWTLAKVRIKALKWSLYLVVSLIITHSFLAYFVRSSRLAQMVQGSPQENLESFLIILFTTALVMFDFGWFREQFCVIVCPYGRFQSVLMDEHSLIVAYDVARGEPRKSKSETLPTKPLLSDKPPGDCVNCFRCVQVCPTGIDIRRGTQMECVACTACIDACDETMAKIRKPPGLIRYDSERGLKGQKPQHFRTRTFAYLGALMVMVFSLIYAVSTREPIQAILIRAVESPYQLMNEKSGEIPLVLNHFKISISNQTFSDTALKITSATPDVDVVIAINPFPTPAGKTVRGDIFIKVPTTLFVGGRAKIKIQMQAPIEGSPSFESIQEVGLVGPGN